MNTSWNRTIVARRGPARVGFALAWCLAAALPVVAAKPVPLAELHVASTPVGATCTLNGAPQGVTPVTLSGLAPGDYLVILSKTGFEPERRTVTLAPGAREALDLPLEAQRGLALLQTIPPGAHATVDGVDRGTTPMLLTDLLLGSHRAHLEAPGCLPTDVELNIDGRTPVKKVVALRPSTATIDVTSTPPGATLVLDGVSHGITPTTLERLEPGAHRLAVSLAGYAPQEQTLRTEPGQQDSVSVVLVPIPARLKVTSIPPRARIYLDNQYRGEAPVTLEGLAPGPYRLRAELAGYTTVGRTLTLDLAADVVEEVRLESNSGILELVTEPAGVTVFVDGEKLGLTSFGTNETDRVSDPLLVQPLTQGSHLLQLTRQGYFGVSTNVDVRKDQTAALHETLKRRFIPDYEVVTALGIDRGVLVEVDKDGDVRLEIRPGVIKLIRAADIKAGRPLQQQALPELAPEAPPAEPVEAPDAAPAP